MMRVCPNCKTENSLPTEGDPTKMPRPVCSKCRKDLFPAKETSQEGEAKGNSFGAIGVSKSWIAVPAKYYLTNIYEKAETWAKANKYFGLIIAVFLLGSLSLLFLPNEKIIYCQYGIGTKGFDKAPEVFTMKGNKVTRCSIAQGMDEFAKVSRQTVTKNAIKFTCSHPGWDVNIDVDRLMGTSTVFFNKDYSDMHRGNCKERESKF